MVPVLPAAEQIAHAASANARMRRICANVGAIVPAAFTFDMRARADLYAHRISLRLMPTGARGDPHTPQIILQAAERLVGFTAGIVLHFGLKRRTKQTLLALF